jgi:pimeloyl-ACP methyl ester carboxylesterase
MVRRQIRAPFFDPDRQDDSIWERRLADYERARASAAVLKATAFFDLSPYLSQIWHPTCLVWGRNDPVLTHTDGDRLLKRMLNAELHKLNECGHLPMVERLAEFVKIAGRFLQTAEPERLDSLRTPDQWPRRSPGRKDP